MTERRKPRPSRRSSRSRAGSAFLAGALSGATLACGFVVGDLPPAYESPRADGGVPDVAAGGNKNDAAPDIGSPEVAPETGISDAKDAKDVEEPCTNGVPWYADEDGDDYGRADTVSTRCPKPPGKWASVAGDCDDNNQLVHPNQATYFGTSYALPNATISFDYDCSGREDENPLQQKGPPNCGLLSLALCGGTGYAATARTGPNVSAYCGSTVRTTCRGIVGCETVTETVSPPFGCR